METDYQTFFENAVEGIFRSTPGGKLITANPAMAALFMYTTPLELIESITDIGTQMYADPKDRKKIRHLLKQDGRVENFEILCLRKDGSSLWVSLNVRVVKDKNGRIKFYEGFIRDIDQRKLAEKLQMESSRLLKQMTDNIPAFVAYVDGATLTYRFVNRKYEDSFQQPRGQIIGKPVLKIIGESSFRFAKPYIDRALKGETCSYENEFKLVEGNRWLKVNYIPDVDESGKVLGIILLNQDITDFKQAEEDLKYNQANLELKVAERTAQLKQENLQRAQVEQALRESEIKYRNIVDYSTSIVLEWDTQGNVVFLNQYGLEFFGFEPEEILGHKVVGTIVEPVDSRGYDLQGKMLVIQEHPEDFYSSENENVKKNGEKMWIAWTNKGIYDEDGKLFKTLSVGIDRTRQRKVEEQLIKSTEINRLAQEISQAGTWEWDLVRNTLDWSPEFRKVFRLKKKIAPSLESWTQVVYPADQEFFTERIQAAIDSRTDLSIEYRIVLPNKGVRWIRMTGKTFLENDQPMRMLGLCLDVTTQKQAEQALLKSRDQLEDLVGQRTKELVTANQRLEQDVTERKQAEQELAVSEARYKSLVDTQSEVIARSNPDGRLIFVNDAYCQAFGRKREELIGNDFIPTVLPDDQPVAASMLEELRLPPHRKPSLTRHITTIGIRWFEWENAAILDEKGNIIELQGTGRDVTERKRAEEALLLSEQSSRQTAERLQMVNQIGEKINSGLGFDQLMQTIFEQCQQIGETDTFYVATYDDVTDMISFPFFYKDGEQRQIAPRNLKENSGLAGYIIQTRKTVYLPDESILPEGVVAVRTPGIYTQSFVGVPLILTERVVGVLSMQSNSLNAYTPEQIHTLELLATQLAIAIQNSQLYEQARVEQNLATELAEQLRIVNQISLKITSGLGFEQLMQTIYEQCLQIGFANTFYVGLYDHTTDILKLPVYFADGEAVYRPPVHLKENPGIASHVIERHQTIYVPDIHNMPAGMTPHTISPTPTKTRTYLGLPLILNGRVVGVLSMQSTSPDAYSPGQIKTLELLATQVAIAIQNSQLFEQVENEKNLVTAVIENLPGAVGLIDQHGNLKRWNKKAEEITGYATQDIEALDYLSLFPEEELARLPDLISEVFSSGRNSTDLQVISNDGRKIPFYVTATRVHIGTEDLLLFIAMDITERKLMEQEIIQNEAIFSSFMENSPVYVFFKDKDIRALRLSSNFDQLLGIPVHQALGKTMDELFPSELARNMVADDLHILHEGQKVDVVEELNGRIYETTKFPIFKDGKPVMLAGFTIDVTERKQAERRLLEVMAAIESASDAIGISDAQGGHFFQNKALSDLLGYKTAEELQAAGGGPAAVKDQSIAKKMFDSIMDGDPWAGELEMVTKDGRVFPAYERANAIKDDAGNIIGLIGIITDITERKKTEQALREAEAFNQAVITNSPIGISVRNRAGELLSANTAWLKTWGISDEEYQGMLQEKFDKLVFDERDKNLAGHEEEVRQVYERGGSLNLPDLETQNFRSGMAEWVSQYYYAIRDEEDQVKRVVTLTEDVSARKQAEAEIVKSRALLERVQEVAHMGSWEIDLDTRLVTASDEACRIYGVKIGEMNLSMVQTIPLEEYRPALDAALAALIKNKVEYNLEFRIQRISDSAIRDIHSVAEYNRENNTVIGSIQDITERKAAERELKEQLDLLERMNNVMVDRELRMLEIKKEVNALLAKAGEKEKYRIFDL